MVTFKRLFQTDRYPSANAGGQDVGLGTTTTDSESTRPTPSPQPSAKMVRPADGSDVERHFQRIERQLEELHDSLQSRPLPVHIPSRTSSRFATRNPRHVDILDAVFSSQQRHPVQPQHQQQQQPQSQRKQRQQQPSKNIETKSPSSASPLSPYNEDVAERNMAPILNKPPRKRSLYTRLVSALSQEDVTERNLSPGKGREGIVRPRSRSTRSVHSSKSPLSPATSQKGSKGANSPIPKETKPVTGLVPREAATRPRSRNGPNEPATAGPRETTQQPQAVPRLRSQRSAPNLSTAAKESPAPPQQPPDRSPDPGPVGHLSVPPAYKQGHTWNSSPLPDSPTLPGQTGNAGKQESRNATTTEAPVSPPVPSPASPPARRASSSLASASPSKPPSKPPCPAPARKNTLNLSINTQVATAGKRPAKPSPRAIQPPTPSSKNDTKYNPSIAEVMNSPLCSPSPTSGVSPIGSSNQRVAEIMDMFKQAYKSTEALSPHPTFETLQDAIVREINSHEAFQRVPVPEPGPAFTPSPTRQCFDRRESAPKSRKNSALSVSGSVSGKEQLAKLKPFKKHRRNSEVSRSISTSVVPAVVNRLSSTAERHRRRHTDAPPPSPRFLDEPVEEMSDDEPVSPTTVPARCQTVPPGAFFSTPATSSISKGTIPASPPTAAATTITSPAASRKTSITPIDTAATAGSVYCMRAQTSTSPISSDGKTSFSIDSCSNSSSMGYNEDVLHLPSPGTTTASSSRHPSTRRPRDPPSASTSFSASSASAMTPAMGKSRWSIFPPQAAAASTTAGSTTTFPTTVGGTRSRSSSVAQ